MFWGGRRQVFIPGGDARAGARLSSRQAGDGRIGKEFVWRGCKDGKQRANMDKTTLEEINVARIGRRPWI